MASNDEGRGSGDCNVYDAANTYLNLLDKQWSLQGPPVTSETDFETGAETQTGTETDTETGKAGIEPKPKRIRRPNKVITTRMVVIEVDSDNFEPKLLAEARMCYENQIGCILWTTATINDEKLKKISDMEHSLLTKLHQVFLFPGRDEKNYTVPHKDPTMKKIYTRAMGKFSGALYASKVRVKTRIIDKKEPYSGIVKDNPTIMEEHFEIFKATCVAEATKEKSEYMKGLQ